MEDPTPPEVVLEDSLASKVLGDMVPSEEAMEDPTPPEVVLEDSLALEELIQPEEVLSTTNLLEKDAEEGSQAIHHSLMMSTRG